MTRKHPEIMAQNPLRLLKRGFASYTEADSEALAAHGKKARVDDIPPCVCASVIRFIPPK
jgi:hypothetical protein